MMWGKAPHRIDRQHRRRTGRRITFQTSQSQYNHDNVNVIVNYCTKCPQNATTTNKRTVAQSRVPTQCPDGPTNVSHSSFRSFHSTISSFPILHHAIALVLRCFPTSLAVNTNSLCTLIKPIKCIAFLDLSIASLFISSSFYLLFFILIFNKHGYFIR